MRIREVSVRRMKNLGNYENLTVELRAELARGEKAARVLHDLDNQARLYLGLDTIEEEQARAALARSGKLWEGMLYHHRQLEELAPRLLTQPRYREAFQKTLALFTRAVAAWRAEEARPEVRAARAALRLQPPVLPEAPALPEPPPAPPPETHDEEDAPRF